MTQIFGQPLYSVVIFFLGFITILFYYSKLKFNIAVRTGAILAALTFLGSNFLLASFIPVSQFLLYLLKTFPMSVPTFFGGAMSLGVIIFTYLDSLLSVFIVEHLGKYSFKSKNKYLLALVLTVFIIFIHLALVSLFWSYLYFALFPITDPMSLIGSL